MTTGTLRAGSFDATAFYAALDAERQSRGMTWRQVAIATKVSASSLTRMAQGRRPDVDSLTALCAWSGLRADSFVRDQNMVRVEPATVAMISTYLRADPNLTSQDAQMLESLIITAYERLKKRS
jgi:transcriptional regulator with XRE-family HTH domain